MKKGKDGFRLLKSLKIKSQIKLEMFLSQQLAFLIVDLSPEVSEMR